jgi:hypothetical protein
LSANRIGLKQKIPFYIRAQRYKKDQACDQVLLPLTVQITPMDVPAQYLQPSFIGFGDLVKMPVMDEFPPPSVNQMVQFLDHFVLIKKIIRIKNDRAKIHP